MAAERISRIDDIETKQWMQGMSSTHTTWTEEEVYNEFINNDTTVFTEDWCKLMMVIVLGKKVAMAKYPEMYV